MIPIYVCKGQSLFFALYLCQWFIINKGLEIASFVIVCGLRCRQSCRQRSHLKLLPRQDSQWSLYCRPVSLFKRFLVKNTQHFGQTKPQWLFPYHAAPSQVGSWVHISKQNLLAWKKTFYCPVQPIWVEEGSPGVLNPYLEVLLCLPACGYSQTDGIAYGWSLKYYLAINDRGG